VSVMEVSDAGADDCPHSGRASGKLRLGEVVEFKDLRWLRMVSIQSPSKIEPENG
jgi:hypothetical protein